MGLLATMGKALGDFFMEIPRAPAPERTVGVTGVVAYDGYVQSPERNAALTGANKWITFDETMLNTSIVASGVRHFLRLTGGVNWKQQPAVTMDERGQPARPRTLAAKADADKAREIADHVQWIYENMEDPWSSVVQRGGRTSFLGFSVQEIVAQNNQQSADNPDGIKGLRGICDRPQRTIIKWHMDDNGRLLGCVQQDPNTFEEIYLRRDKILYMVDDALTSSPEGIGLLRHVVEPARRLSRYEQLEGYSYESDLRGIPKGFAPIAAMKQAIVDGRMTPEDMTNALRDLRSFMNNHIRSPALSILLDSSPFTDQGENLIPSNLRQWDIELLKTDTGAQQPVNVTIERLNREIARILGVEYLLLGGDTKGSHALSKDKTQTFGALVQATLSSIGWAVDRQATPAIMKRNGWPMKLRPKSVPDAVALRDIAEVVDTLVKLSQAGAPMLPNDPANNEVRGMINLSRARDMTPEEIELRQAPPAKPGSPAGGVPRGPQGADANGPPQSRRPSTGAKVPNSGTAKRDVSEREREHLADEGHAMPDGSYPIATRQDLRNAIHSWGRAKPSDRAAVARHIHRRAVALDETDELPTSGPLAEAMGTEEN